MRGQLKIFYSYIAGAGKTYAMLEAAHQLLTSGRDVVIGYVEPHDRPDTIALMKDLEIIPPKEISYKGMVLKELDLTAILKRNPEFVLIDELAHTNIPGGLHAKRYQDVLEVLDAGISVYTTVNIQHLDSLHDIIEQITGIDVKETVPDYIFDSATQVELVDIESTELQARLQKGQIYDLSKVDTALQNFFTRKKLSALREVALRRGAQRLSEENLKNLMFSNEVILVCVSQYKSNERVIRTAARMAKAFGGRLQALYVESSAAEEMSTEEKNNLENNMKLAKSLGAEIVHVYGEDIGEQIVSYAKMTSVTKLVVGRSKKNIFNFRQNVVDYISEHSPDIDIHIIPNLYEAEEKGKRQKPEKKLNVHMVLICAFILILCGAVCQVIHNQLSSVMCFMIGLIVIAYLADRMVYPLVSSIIAIALYNFFGITPYYSFHITGSKNISSYLFMIVFTLFVSMLTSRLKRASVAAKKSSNRSAVMLNATQRLNKATTRKEVYGILQDIIRDLYKQEFYILSMDEIEKASYLSEKELGIIKWSVQNRHSAGRGTETLSDIDFTCFPIRVGNYVGGALCFRDMKLDSGQRNMIKAILAEAALSLNRFLLLESEENHRFTAEKERLKLVLLRGVSHDMRTPLAIIEGNSLLLKTSPTLTDSEKESLIQGIHTEATWMSQMVDNLLNLTKVTNESFQFNKHPEIMEDIIQTAIEKCKTRRGKRKIMFQENENSTVVNVDTDLMVQVLINLIDNAIKHTSDNGIIEVRLKKQDDIIVVSIEDDGEGIKPDILEYVFDDFLTTDTRNADANRGMGLGLGICKRIVEEHGGKMFAKNTGHGAEVGFCLKGDNHGTEDINH